MPVKWTLSFALYRALLRQAEHVALPLEITSKWPPKGDPLTQIIRDAFHRNRRDTSPRLVFPALQAGYRALATLNTAAREPSSPELDSILAFLPQQRARLDRNAAAQQAVRDARPKIPTYSPYTPLLVNVTPEPTPADPNPLPKYTINTRPLPRSQLPEGSRRRIPVLDMSQDVPFLRFTKPQPLALSRLLLRKNRERVARAQNLIELETPLLSAARSEDEWEALMAAQLAESSSSSTKKQQQQQPHGRRDAAVREPSFAQTVRTHGIHHIYDSIKREREDYVAKADAMRELIAKEKALLAQERLDDHLARRAKWEAKMQAEHGDGWEEMIRKEKEARDQARVERLGPRRVAFMRPRSRGVPREALPTRSSSTIYPRVQAASPPRGDRATSF